jgi:hypothetical protein
MACEVGYILFTACISISVQTANTRKTIISHKEVKMRTSMCIFIPCCFIART